MTGEQLKDILYTARITQAELAKKTGMSTQLISQALKAADIKTGFLEKLCDALNVSMSFFYPTDTLTNNNLYQTGEGNQQNSGDNVQQTMGADKELINQMMAQLDAQRKQIEKLTDLLINK